MYYLQRRSIALCIVLSLITCGIYGIYWMYKMAEDINYVRNDPNAMSPGLVVVLSIVTCGIYYIYWMYKAGETVDAVRIQQGMMPGSKAILYMILTLLGVGIVSQCLLQNDLNEMSDGMRTGGYSPQNFNPADHASYGGFAGPQDPQQYNQTYNQVPPATQSAEAPQAAPVPPVETQGAMPVAENPFEPGKTESTPTAMEEEIEDMIITDDE